VIARTLSPLLQHRLAHFPAVTLVGPRQCGKTTLARTLPRLTKVGELIKPTRVVLLRRVRQSVMTEGQWVTNLPDYLATDT
jgi:stage III sporulation protein SpoIIIAA